MMKREEGDGTEYKEGGEWFNCREWLVKPPKVLESDSVIQGQDSVRELQLVNPVSSVSCQL